jgi:NADH-quinone oxidoreductase subunit H
MCAGTLSLVKVGDLQSGGWHTWLAFRNPFVFCAAVTYFIAALASCKRAPFDLPEGESELVGGFHTEYSGWRWCLFFFAEYAAMFVVCGLAVILFFGGWHSPLPASWALDSDALWARAINGLVFGGPIWFITKCVFFLYVQLWLRWTLPRIRIDQVLYACVQVMLPLVMVLLLANAVWELWVRPGDLLYAIANVITSIIGGIFAVGFLAIAGYGWWNRRRLVTPRGWSYAIDLLKGS